MRAYVRLAVVYVVGVAEVGVPLNLLHRWLDARLAAQCLPGTHQRISPTAQDLPLGSLRALHP